MLGALAERDLLNDALVIVTSDHGEGLGDHDEVTHGLLTYESTQHVPLLI
ncbi:MAG: sulfatase-like hydrolase/transferase, partial [Deltaproteobacteria bacterium]|nr:sulfatase-like hydrolase/transferase [Deltaproteobacteria bacterium]